MKQLTPDQIQELINVIRVQHLSFSVNEIGASILSKEDKELLSKYNIKVPEEKAGKIDEAFKFGQLSIALKKDEVDSMNYPDFKKFVADSKMMPYTEKEQSIIDYLKQKTYSHIKNLEGKIGSDLKVAIFNKQSTHRAQYEKLIQNKLLEGAINRKSLAEIVSELGHATGDWGRNWQRIVYTEMHNAFEFGRAAQIQRLTGENDPEVYKHTFGGVCRHCIKAYLTHGLSSPPRIFKLSELVANGTNIGKKAIDWLPVLGAMHPHSITDSGTSILTDNGWKKIKDINVGDLVLTHKGRFKKVLSTLKDFPCPTHLDSHKVSYTVYYKHPFQKDADDFVSINFTGDHKVLTQRWWIEVKDLTLNDKLYKLMKKCVECDTYMESYDNTHKNTCSLECQKKYRSKNSFKQWEERISNNKVDEFKEKISNKVKENWVNGVHENTLINLKSEKTKQASKERMLNGGALKAMLASSINITSKPQKKLFEMVFSLFPETQLEYKIFNKSLDIAIVNHKIDIEFDGEFWHKDRKDSDNKRDELLESNGWHVLRYSKLPKLGVLHGDIEAILQNHDGLYKFVETDIVFIKKSYTGNFTKLYDIEVEDDNSFIARGVVVHNCRCLINQSFSHQKYNPETRMYKQDLTNWKPSIHSTSLIKITIGDKSYQINSAGKRV